MSLKFLISILKDHRRLGPSTIEDMNIVRELLLLVSILMTPWSELETLAEKYMKRRREGQSSIHAQWGRPSWASSKHRHLSDEDDGGEDWGRSKRWKGNS
jgi:hypothetical protein